MTFRSKSRTWNVVYCPRNALMASSTCSCQGRQPKGFHASNGRGQHSCSSYALHRWCQTSWRSGIVMAHKKIWWIYPFRRSHIRMAFFYCIKWIAETFWGHFWFFPRPFAVMQEKFKKWGFYGGLVSGKNSNLIFHSVFSSVFIFSYFFQCTFAGGTLP